MSEGQLDRYGMAQRALEKFEQNYELHLRFLKFWEKRQKGLDSIGKDAYDMLDIAIKRVSADRRQYTKGGDLSDETIVSFFIKVSTSMLSSEKNKISNNTNTIINNMKYVVKLKNGDYRTVTKRDGEQEVISILDFDDYIDDSFDHGEFKCFFENVSGEYRVILCFRKAGYSADYRFKELFSSLDEAKEKVSAFHAELKRKLEKRSCSSVFSESSSDDVNFGRESSQGREPESLESVADEEEKDEEEKDTWGGSDACGFDEVEMDANEYLDSEAAKNPHLVDLMTEGWSQSSHDAVVLMHDYLKRSVELIARVASGRAGRPSRHVEYMKLFYQKLYSLCRERLKGVGAEELENISVAAVFDDEDFVAIKEELKEELRLSSDTEKRIFKYVLDRLTKEID